MELNWLITGGCGFIGINLIDALLSCSETPTRIRVLDDLSVGTREDLAKVCSFTDGLNSGGKVELVEGCITNIDATISAATGSDIIVHLAANTGVGPSIQNPRQDMDFNVVGTFNMLEAARKAKCSRFVFASSRAPAGEVEPPIHEELAPHPVSPYGASKLAGEGYCSAYAKSFGLDTVALRFGNVYGVHSGHKSSVVAKFIRQTLNCETLKIYGDGNQTRDFIYITDLIEAIIKASNLHGIGGEVFQIATHKETSVSDMLETLSTAFEAMGLARPSVEFSEPLVGDVMRNYSDTTKAKQRLGWQAKVNLEEGLKKTVEYFLDQQNRH